MKQNVFLFKKIFKQYVDFNLTSNYNFFFGFMGIEYTENEFGLDETQRIGPLDFCGRMNKFPLLPCQFNVLYELLPDKYNGYVDGDFVNLIGCNLKNNSIFLLNKKGELVDIMLYLIGSEHRKLILDFFSKKTDTLTKFRYLQHDNIEMTFAPFLANANSEYNNVNNSRLEFIK